MRKTIEHLGSGAVLLIGNLKVGKSALFSCLAGARTETQLYPGTAVELTVGRSGSDRFPWLIDAPGFHSLHDGSEDAFVARDLLLRGSVGAVLLVLDTKNLRRGLALALQLAGFRVPLVLALNMDDEARQRGIEVDAEALASLLGVPVVPTVASEGQGASQLRKALASAAPPRVRLAYPGQAAPVAEALERILSAAGLVPGGLAFLLMSGTPGALAFLEEKLGKAKAGEVAALLAPPTGGSQVLSDVALTEAVLGQAEDLVAQVMDRLPAPWHPWRERLSVWTRRPATGIPIALLVLALIYLFVGRFGAGVLVDILEGKLFNQMLIPWVSGLVGHIPWGWLRDLLNGPFGLITVGITLPLGIVLPALATFFIVFALLEDSGYMPRLSLLADRFMRLVGLNGKGVLPILMGFSCVTAAVLSTRMLDTRKQRLIATLLLVLGVPCAPLLAVMAVLLAKLSIWASVTLFGVLFLQFLLVGFLANRILPGRRGDLILELPPLRLPRIKNILLKTGHRLYWFLKEAIPFFLLGCLVLFALDQLGLLAGLQRLLQPILQSFLGLPRESADVFLMTIMRREAGAALLLPQAAAGLYDGVQIVVLLLVMTLMFPCINTVLATYRAQGFRRASAMLGLTMVYPLLVGGLLNGICRALSVQF